MEFLENRYLPTYKDNDDIIKEFELIKTLDRHNIIKERSELYHQFIVNLIYYIHDTFLGDDYIRTDDDVEGHFRWCFNKVCEEFKEEEISFNHRNGLFTYLFEYFYKTFYDKDARKTIIDYKKFWSNIFETKKVSKNRDRLSVLLETYKLFDLALEK